MLASIVGLILLLTPAPVLAEDPPRPWAAYTFAGVGGAALAVAGITGFMWLDRKSTVDAECDREQACTPAGREAALDARSLGTINTVSLGIGIVGIGVGAYLLLRPAPRRVVAPMLLPGGGGAAALVRF
jgi:hypothetical protein